MIDVKEYLEYRDFLRDYYTEKKGKTSYFSYRYIADKVGIDPSHLVKIFQKQRHIGNASIDTFISFCSLTGTHAVYFDALVRFNKAKTDREAKTHYEKLVSLTELKSFVVEKGAYEYYSKWYHSAILTLLDFYDFNGNYEALAKKLSPAILPSEAKKTVRLLLQLGLISQAPDGRFRLTSKIVTSGDKATAIAVKTFQEETMRLAMESLHRHVPAQRNISTVTITIAQSDLDKVNQMIKNFRASLLSLAHDTQKPDKVYQLNVQLFPVSK